MRGLPALNLHVENLGLGGIIDLRRDLPIAGGFSARGGDEQIATGKSTSSEVRIPTESERAKAPR